jgi:hypothetical protein
VNTLSQSAVPLIAVIIILCAVLVMVIAFANRSGP